MSLISSVLGVGASMPAQQLTGKAPAAGVAEGAESGKGSFAKQVTNFIDEVDSMQKTAGAETQKVLLGQSDNLHQSIIALNEASVAFTLMVEVRNKMIESYQEVMRMQV